MRDVSSSNTRLLSTKTGRVVREITADNKRQQTEERARHCRWCRRRITRLNLGGWEALDDSSRPDVFPLGERCD